jgi:hypothetical protein
MSLTELPLGRNNSVMTSLFPPTESLVVTFRLGTGNSRTFFLRCTSSLSRYYMSTLEGRPGERHLYSLQISGGPEAGATPICLTSSQQVSTNLSLPTAHPSAASEQRTAPDMSLPAAHPCLYSRIHLSPTFSTYVQVRKGYYG